jgi:hypothetical protein
MRLYCNHWTSGVVSLRLTAAVPSNTLAILDYILSGAILRAMEDLDTHFPQVLDGHSSSSTETTSSQTRAPSRASAHTSTPSPVPLPPIGKSAAKSSDHHSTPVFVTSTAPEHIHLNLQIQSFIESFRQLAPSPSSSTSSSMSSLSSQTTTGTDIRPTNDADMTASGPSGAASGLLDALAAAQGLHTGAKKLKPEERAVYLQEIKDVGALFAYSEPETSILKDYLKQDRRVALAEQVNRAIIRELSSSSPSSPDVISY